MKRKSILFMVIALTIAFNSCQNKCKRHPDDKPLSKQQTEKLSPETVQEILEAGNKCFAHEQCTQRDHSNTTRIASLEGQWPKAIILSCLDSRVPVEDVFDRRLSDVFVARVAGNIANPDIIGSMEFGVSNSSKLIVVMGHEKCGAIMGAINQFTKDADGTYLCERMEHLDSIAGNLNQLLAEINMQAVPENNEQCATDDTMNFVHDITIKNVKATIDHIRTQSDFLRERENLDKDSLKRIKIVGAMYDMKTGKVRFFDHPAKPR